MSAVSIGPYRTVRVIESGAHVDVIEAIDTRVDRPVHLKVAKDDIDTSEFVRNARLLMAIVHPNVAVLYDYSTTSQPYFAYEPLRGPSLRKLVAERGPLSKDAYASFFAQLADGLAALHSRGLAHGSLSLDSAFLEEDGHVVLDSSAVLFAEAGTLEEDLRGFVMLLKAAAPQSELTDLLAFMQTASPSGSKMSAVRDRLRPVANVDLHAMLLDQTVPNLTATMREILRLIEANDVDAATTLATRGRYEKFELLGCGAMGRVVKAWDKRLRRQVAIKTMLREHSDDDAKMRFHREARALGRIRHPGVVEVVDYSGRAASLPFIVLEYIDGSNLEAAVRVSRFPETVALCALAELLEAAQAIHDQGLVHRDLKPENVFTERSGRLVIGDFGIVRGFLDNTGTFVRSETKAVGSPAFSSPEQVFEPDTIGPMSDVFSLGSVFYALLTGHSPFLGSGLLETLTKLRSLDWSPPAEETSEFALDLFSRIFVQEPSERPAAGALAVIIRNELVARRITNPRQALRSFLNDHDATSRTSRSDAPHGAGNTTTKNVGKRTTARTIVLSVLGLCVFLFTLVGTVVIVKARQATKPLPPVLVPAEVPMPIPPKTDPPPPPTERVESAPEPTPEPKRPPVRPKVAVVRFIVRPWAKVIVDGDTLGTTPVLQTTDLKPGKHTVLFENPAFQSKTLLVDVKAGEQRDLRVQLEK